MRLAVSVVAAMAVAMVMAPASPFAAADFAPKITFEVSTTQATAHPDARITIDNTASSETLKTTSLTLPKGFWGSLAAVSAKCPYATAVAGNCAPSAKVGTVKATATVDDSDVVLSGTVYMTTPGDVPGHDYSTTDPAWLSIKIVPTVGGVTSFGPIVTPGRVILNNRVLPTPKTGAVTGPESMFTQIGGLTGYPDIPSEVTDSHGRKIEFKLQTITVDLKSDQSPTPPLQPLLTNPSKCGANPISASFSGWDGGTANNVAAENGTFTVTGCDNVKFRPATSDIALTNNAANAASGIQGTISFPSGSASISTARISMPPIVSFNSLGFATQYMCSANAASGLTLISSTLQPDPNPYFIPSNCPVDGSAKVGEATITSPLVPDPLQANVMFVSRGSTPTVVIYADDTTGANNPHGFSLAVVGTNSVTDMSPDCPESVGCTESFQTWMNAVPDAPVSSISFNIDPAHASTARPVANRPVLKVLPPDDPSCFPTTDFAAHFTSNSAGNSAVRVSPQTITGCNARNGDITGLDTVASTNVTSNPAIAFSPSPMDCKFGDFITDGFDASCGSPVSASPALETGLHLFSVSPDGGGEVTSRRIAIQGPPTPPEADTSPPTGLQFSAQPSNPTSDTTPSATFAATGATTYQCSLNGGAYLPCAAGTYTVPDALIPGDTTYTIDVRALDAAGNISAPITASFKVDVPFDPTFDVDLSTDQARAHPTMDVSITSGSHEDMKDLALNLPDGFFGGLSSVVSQCPVATAAAGGCDASSQVGTVKAEAIVDESTIRLPGTVHMTTPIAPGDPAGLYIDVPAKLQDVDQGHITVPIRLTIRGQVQGINSIATNLPNGITPTNGIDGPSEFDLRSIELKLRDNPSASQPLLTNPSQCGTSAFAASFTGTGSTAVSKSVPFAATNCGALAFAPQLGINITDLNGQPPRSPLDTTSNVMRLTAHLAANPNDAGIRAIDLLFPKPVTINVSKLPTPCTPEQYAAGGAEACPASSNIGTVSATSPLLREPLTGSVFILKQTGLPKLIVALRGAINTDIIGRNEFVNNTQIHTVFDTTPDVPLSSFDMNISSLITARDEVCESDQSQWNVTGTMFAYNGAASAVVNPLVFSCKAVVSAKFKNKGKKSTATINVRAPGGAKLKSATIKLPKGLKFIKKGLKKRLTVKASTPTGSFKKLKTKCFKTKGSNRIDVNFCKSTKNSKLMITFSSGSLEASKKVKKPKFSISAVDALKRKSNYSIKAK